MVATWSHLLLHIKKVLGLIPRLDLLDLHHLCLVFACFPAKLWECVACDWLGDLSRVYLFYVFIVCGWYWTQANFTFIPSGPYGVIAASRCPCHLFGLVIGLDFLHRHHRIIQMSNYYKGILHFVQILQALTCLIFCCLISTYCFISFLHENTI